MYISLLIVCYKKEEIYMPSLQKIFGLKKARSVTKLIALGVSFALLFSAGSYYFLKDNTSWANVTNLALPEALKIIKPEISNKDLSLPVIRGIEISNLDRLDLKFNFDTMSKKDISKEDMVRLIKYFLGFLSIPTDNLWVNLSSYEKDRMLPDNLAKLDIGKDMLLEDFLLKQIASYVTDPKTTYGKQYWNKVREVSYNLLGHTKAGVNSCYKVWIVPQKAVICQNKSKDSLRAFIKEAKLKVMLEEDYLQVSQSSMAKMSKADDKVNQAAKEIFKRDLIPVIEYQVNNAASFAPLRQLYYALILANYFKSHLGVDKVYGRFIDRSSANNISLKNPEMVKENIYNSYLKNAKEGVYNYLSKEYDQYSKEKVLRKYFSGGIVNSQIAQAQEVIDQSDSKAFTDQQKKANKGQEVGAQVKVKKENFAKRIGVNNKPDFEFTDEVKLEIIQFAAKHQGKRKFKDNPELFIPRSEVLDNGKSASIVYADNYLLTDQAFSCHFEFKGRTYIAINIDLINDEEAMNFYIDHEKNECFWQEQLIELGLKDHIGFSHTLTWAQMLTQQTDRAYKYIRQDIDNLDLESLTSLVQENPKTRSEYYNNIRTVLNKNQRLARLIDISKVQAMDRNIYVYAKTLYSQKAPQLEMPQVVEDKAKVEDQELGTVTPEIVKRKVAAPLKLSQETIEEAKKIPTVGARIRFLREALKKQALDQDKEKWEVKGLAKQLSMPEYNLLSRMERDMYIIPAGVRKQIADLFGLDIHILYTTQINLGKEISEKVKAELKNKQFGEIIRGLREARGLSREDLAKRISDLSGVSYAADNLEALENTRGFSAPQEIVQEHALGLGMSQEGLNSLMRQEEIDHYEGAIPTKASKEEEKVLTITEQLREQLDAAKNVGERISILREARGWREKELAQRLGHKNHNVISRYQRGKYVPFAKAREQLAKVLGVEIKELCPAQDKLSANWQLPQEEAGKLEGETFGEIIKGIRIVRGLSANDLARRMTQQTGIQYSGNDIELIESNEGAIVLKEIIDIYANGLGVEPQVIVNLLPEANQKIYQASIPEQAVVNGGVDFSLGLTNSLGYSAKDMAKIKAMPSLDLDFEIIKVAK